MPTTDPITTAMTRIGLLTGREREIFDLLGRSQSTAEIAGRLGISARTVKFHIANIRTKLGGLSLHLLCAASYLHATGPAEAPAEPCAAQI
ncbi:helix-turn-helix transcriptional regulator [Streptomyces sp. NPDC048420]|uniref:helix-turn-helix transcriptional regulator n=1 Tax=Streptomyces sp. NPDC048420 TaxID=3155755 RepID=UPI00343F7AF7